MSNVTIERLRVTGMHTSKAVVSVDGKIVGAIVGRIMKRGYGETRWQYKPSGSKGGEFFSTFEACVNSVSS